GATTSISSNITSAAATGLTISGAGTLSLTNPSTYTGQTTFNGGGATILSGTNVSSTGTLVLGNNAALGNGASTFSLVNGNVQTTMTTGLTLPNPTVFNNADITF